MENANRNEYGLPGPDDAVDLRVFGLAVALMDAVHRGDQLAVSAAHVALMGLPQGLERATTALAALANDAVNHDGDMDTLLTNLRSALALAEQQLQEGTL